MSFTSEERDAISAAFHTSKDQIHQLEVFLRILDRELLKKGIAPTERKVIHDAVIEASAQIST